MKKLIRITAVCIVLCLISPVLAADNTESGQSNVLKVIKKQHDVSVKTVPHQDYVGSEAPPSVAEKRPEAAKKPKHAPVREAAKRHPEKMPKVKKTAVSETVKNADLPGELRSPQEKKEIERPKAVEDETSAGPSETQGSLLKKRFLAADKNSAVYFETAEDILEIEPSNDEIRSAIAWDCFNVKDYQCALRHFEILSRDNPGNMDYQKGMIYSLINTGDKDKALLLLEKYAGGPDDEMSALRHDMYSMRGNHNYNENNYGQAEYFLLKALEIKPEDRNDRTLLAWTYYRQGKYDRAVKLFKELYISDKSPEAAANLMLAFEKLTGDEQTLFLSDLQEEQDPVLLKMAADRHYENNAPITASYIYTGEETCYRNCNSPVLELSGYYRNKSGDSGL